MMQHIKMTNIALAVMGHPAGISSFGEQPSPRAESPLLDRASTGLIRHGRRMRSGAMQLDGDMEAPPHHTSNHSVASSRQWGTDTGSNAAHAVEEQDASLEGFPPVPQTEQFETISRASSLAPPTTRQGDQQNPGLLDQLDIHAIVSSSMDEATRSLSRRNSSLLLSDHHHHQQQQQQQDLPSLLAAVQQGTIGGSLKASETHGQPATLGHEQHVCAEPNPHPQPQPQLQQEDIQRLQEGTAGASDESSEMDSSEGAPVQSHHGMKHTLYTKSSSGKRWRVR
eukprot:437563-Pelagomonas_calceolata.AAC.10